MNQEPAGGLTRANYVFGFVLSLGLTLAAYFLVHKHVVSHHLVYSDNFMLGALAVLAITQLIVQLVFFLHLDKESRPWWNNTALAFAAIVVVIIVAGSIWIMANLNYHHGGIIGPNGQHLSPHQSDQLIIQGEGIHQ